MANPDWWPRQCGLYLPQNWHSVKSNSIYKSGSRTDACKYSATSKNQTVQKLTERVEPAIFKKDRFCFESVLFSVIALPVSSSQLLSFLTQFSKQIGIRETWTWIILNRICKYRVHPCKYPETKIKSVSLTIETVVYTSELLRLSPIWLKSGTLKRQQKSR